MGRNLTVDRIACDAAQGSHAVPNPLINFTREGLGNPHAVLSFLKTPTASMVNYVYLIDPRT